MLGILLTLAVRRSAAQATLDRDSTSKSAEFFLVSSHLDNSQNKTEIFFSKNSLMAHPSLLVDFIKTSEQQTSRLRRTSQERILLQELQKMLGSVLSKVVARFTRDQRGATMLEYGLLVGLVAIAAIIAVTAMGGALSNMFTDASNAL